MILNCNNMECYTWVLVLFSAFFVHCIEHDFKGFDDSILFGINWPGSQDNIQNLVDGELEKVQSKEVLKVKSSRNEQYNCHIPELNTKESTVIEEYDGPSPFNLLKPLFAQKICSYRLESYWSYEVCHGRYIRQYHEEREGKKVKTQEYYLGHWSIEKQSKIEAEVKDSQDSKADLKTTRVEGLTLPYVEMVMDDGTICDLSSKPRMTRVLYVCYKHGKHEVYSFKETSTCEYEIVILSPLLCEHPQFKPKDVSENIIDCIPIGGAPKKPNDLLRMEFESLKFQHDSMKVINNDKDSRDVLAVLKVEKIDKDGETHLKFELHPLNDDDLTLGDGTSSPDRLADKSTDKSSERPSITDDSPVRAFLNGENCLNGGTGWWKYEFCYGKHVIQYHVDRTGEKTTLLLGKFDEKTHLNWINENQSKVPKPVEQRTSVSHYYANGDVCDKTGRPRHTEVKLKCLENSSSPAQVSLYLLEPRTCHYILGVESPLICDLLPLADRHGLIRSTKPVFKDSLEPVEEGTSGNVEAKNVLKDGND